MSAAAWHGSIADSASGASTQYPVPALPSSLPALQPVQVLRGRRMDLHALWQHVQVSGTTAEATAGHKCACCISDCHSMPWST